MNAETGADITRDHNNLMNSINLDTTLHITNYRTANGLLHRRIIDSAGVVTFIDRLGDTEFRNGVMSLIHHNDGYIKINRPVPEELRISEQKTHTATEEAITIHSDRVLLNGADETNSAQEFINLMEGFEVDSGAVYTAQIDTFPIGSLSYHWIIRDHLGSPRIIFSDVDSNGVPSIDEEKNYYAFGLEWDEPTPDRVKSYRQSYNDKEAIGKCH